MLFLTFPLWRRNWKTCLLGAPSQDSTGHNFFNVFLSRCCFFGCVFFISSWRVTLHKTSFFLEDNTFVNYLKKRLMLLILMEETMMVQGKAYTLSFKEPLKYSLFISAVFRCRLVIHRHFKKGRSGLWTVSMNNTQASKKKEEDNCDMLTGRFWRSKNCKISFTTRRS